VAEAESQLARFLNQAMVNEGTGERLGDSAEAEPGNGYGLAGYETAYMGRAVRGVRSSSGGRSSSGQAG